MNKAMMKFRPMVSMASLRLSALPPYWMEPSAGNTARRPGSTSDLIWAMAVSSETLSGGLRLTLTVRLPFTLRTWPGPVARSTVTSSPNGTTSPPGVTIGVVASSSGVSQPSARMMISMRFSPLKYSPSQRPLPRVRTKRCDTAPVHSHLVDTRVIRDHPQFGFGQFNAGEGLNIGAWK